MNNDSLNPNNPNGPEPQRRPLVPPTPQPVTPPQTPPRPAVPGEAPAAAGAPMPPSVPATPPLNPMTMQPQADAPVPPTDVPAGAADAPAMGTYAQPETANLQGEQAAPGQMPGAAPQMPEMAAQMPATPTNIPPAKPKKNKTTMIILAAVGGVVLVALVVILIIVLNSGNKETESAEVYDSDTVTVVDDDDSEPESETAITCSGITYEKQEGYEYKCTGTMLYVGNEAQIWMTARSYVKASLETVANDFESFKAAIESGGMKVSNDRVQTVLGEKMITLLATKDGQTEYVSFSRFGDSITAVTEVGTSSGTATINDLETALKLLSGATEEESAQKKIVESDVTELELYGWELSSDE